jgi:hypothetical protein
MKKLTAEKIAGSPKYFYDVFSYKGNLWECLGYSKTGKTIKFARLIDSKISGKLRQISIYIHPEELLELVKKAI